MLPTSSLHSTDHCMLYFVVTDLMSKYPNALCLPSIPLKSERMTMTTNTMKEKPFEELHVHWLKYSSSRLLVFDIDRRWLIQQTCCAATINFRAPKGAEICVVSSIPCIGCTRCNRATLHLRSYLSTVGLLVIVKRHTLQHIFVV